MVLFHPTPPPLAPPRTAGRSAMQWVVKLLLRLMAASFRYRPALRRCLRSDQGWINFTAGIRTRSGSIQAAIRFKEGRVSVRGGLPEDTDMPWCSGRMPPCVDSLRPRPPSRSP